MSTRLKNTAAAAAPRRVDPAATHSGSSKSQRAYHWIKHRISTQDFPPGFRLVLATIGEKLQMSVVPVREAIRQLEAEGLITFERNIGARVAMLDDTEYRNSMGALALLEAAATVLSLPFLSAADISRARNINTKLEAELSALDPAEFTQLNRTFHEQLYHRCPNPRLKELVDQEWDRLARLRSSTFSFVPTRAYQSVREHEHLLFLIESQAPAHIFEEAARAHTNATLSAYLAAEQP